MKTIDGFCIKELRFRSWRELWGSTSDCKKRINVTMSLDLHNKLSKISERIDVNTTEIIRVLLSEFVNQTHVEEVSYEENK